MIIILLCEIRFQRYFFEEWKIFLYKQKKLKLNLMNKVFFTSQFHLKNSNFLDIFYMV